ncbi:MAG: polyphosphate kinase 2 family protein [Kiritimatiellaeota bacterium]|nr:polyphosphate kinase 2 family protein [Kiritimatiellota bacterium]
MTTHDDFYERFCIKPGEKVDLGRVAPDLKKWKDKGKVEALLEQNRKRLFDLQYRLYAENRQSLLVVLQAMDAGGKDGTINHVLSAMNPQGCRAQAFKVPTSLEAAHDFLWREHAVAPRHGEVVIFNRSHYENVLVVRVHGKLSKKELHQRYAFINDFERLLHDNRTTVVKFFLHISKEEQLARFGERLNDPTKHWKISENDYKEREYWDDYMAAFNEAINETSTRHAPWFVIPANRKKIRNLAISSILVETLERMNPQPPAPTVNIDAIRQLYHRAAKT